MEPTTELLRNFEMICSQFEKDWSVDQKPSFESFLSQAEPQYRSQLLMLLLERDIRLRTESGTPVSFAVYENEPGVTHALFQNCLDLVQQRSQFNLDHSTVHTLSDTKVERVPGLETDHIGPYRLLEIIGQGGMGVVWKAEQSHPIQRELAIKVIRSDFESDEVIQRFETERQALAIMDHPNIARIVDAGTTLQGRPYFAMELCEGQPLSKYCDDRKLDIFGRLKIFTDICLAVQHAHQKGIIHRDLKPSNILVADVDGRPVAKVIDFGLAKVLQDSQLTVLQKDKTAFGQLLGTLKHMSPEQVSLTAGRTDTRSDIYSLGIILYELVVGTTPLDSESLTHHSLLEILETIQHHIPERPSRCLMDNTKQQSQICQCRSTDLPELNRLLSGDLDWIVMKAIEKDCDRRYQSASEFAADVERFLHTDPVLARPPSTGYRVAKFIRRNRVAVVAASLLVMTLVAGIVGTSLGWAYALAAEERAREQFHQAEAAREAEIAARKAEAERAEGERVAKEKAEKRLTQMKDTNQVLISVFKDLDIRKKQIGQEPLERRLVDRLIEAGKLIQEDQDYSDPKYQAQLQMELGKSLIGLGYPSEALEQFKFVEQTLEKLTAESEAGWRALFLYNLGRAYLANGKPELAKPMFEQAVDSYRIISGENHKNTLASMHSLAVTHVLTGSQLKAIELLEHVVPWRKRIYGNDGRGTLISMSVLATAYERSGQLEKAIKRTEEVHEARKTSLGPDSMDTLTSLSNLAGLKWKLGDVRQSFELQQQAFERMQDQLGKDHPNTLSVMTKLAKAHQSLGDKFTSRALVENAIPLLKNRPGPKHPTTLTAQSILASLDIADNHVVRAIPILRHCYETSKAEQGKANPDTLAYASQLGVALYAAGRIDEAGSLCDEAVEISRSQLGPTHLSTIQAMIMQGKGLNDSGQVQQATDGLRQAVETSTALSPVENTTSLDARIELARSLFLSNQLVEAEEILASLLGTWKHKLDAQIPLMLRLVGDLNQVLLMLGKTGDAESAIGDLVELQSEIDPESWQTGRAKLQLGHLLLVQNKEEQASEMLEAGVALIRQNHKLIPFGSRVDLAIQLVALMETIEQDNQRSLETQTLVDLQRLAAEIRLGQAITGLTTTVPK